MPLLPSAFRRALRDKALAASRRLSTGPEWEGHVRREFGLLAPGEGWREQVTDGFHRRYYGAGEAGRTWKDTRYLGVPTWKVPLDLWVYQELLWELRPVHPRLTYVVASSTDPGVVAQVAERARGAGPVLVVLDSDHRRDHVLAELRTYAPWSPRAAPWWWRTPTRRLAAEARLTAQHLPKQNYRANQGVWDKEEGPRWLRGPSLASS